MIDLDSTEREEYLCNIIFQKKSLRKLYEEFYLLYSECINRCPETGIDLEIGSGAGFIQHIIPNVVTSDVLSYKSVSTVIDAMQMPFTQDSLRSVFMLNTLHHIPDVRLFFNELDRCLIPGGRLFIIDQFSGPVSDIIYKYLHHEEYCKKAKEWQFASTGPLSGSNGALCWIIFYRDLELFLNMYPQLRVTKIIPHTPLRYWLSGGLKKWSLMPSFLFGFWTKVDHLLAKILPPLCSFVSIEIEKKITH